MLKLDEDWRDILRYAWSIRLMLLAGVFSGLQAALPIIDEWVYIPRGVMAVVTGLIVCAALVSRLVAQRKLKS